MRGTADPMLMRGLFENLIGNAVKYSASGVPVAAFPVSGPRDVVGDVPVAVLDQDLRAACLNALALSREECRAFALGKTWEASARCFLANVRRVSARAAMVAGETSEATA